MAADSTRPTIAWPYKPARRACHANKHAGGARIPRAELARLEKIHAVLAAAEAGWSQREIASRVGIEQPEISRLLKKARLRPDVRERTPREVLLRYAVGELDHQQMMDELEHWDCTFGGPPADDLAADAYVRGTWDQIERAGDLLSDDDYQRLFEATAPARWAASRH